MIRILHLLDEWPDPGGWDQALALLDRLDPERFELHLAGRPPATLPAQAQAAGDRWHPLPARRAAHPFWRPWPEACVVRLLREQHFDLVHTHSGPRPGLCGGRRAARRCGVPLIVHTHLALPCPAFTPPWQRALFLARERRLRAVTDFFIASSHSVRAEARQLGLLDWAHSRTIYPGFDYTHLDEPAGARTWRQRLALPESAPTVLVPASADPQVPELVVDALRVLVGAHPHLSLLVPVEGRRRARWESALARGHLQRHVCWLATDTPTAEAVKAADLVVSAGRGADVSQALRVAMLLGRPVVAPEVASLPEWVQHGETGLFYEPGKAHQLASHVKYLLDHPTERYRLGVNARRFTRPLLDANTAARHLEAIYVELLQRKLPGRQWSVPAAPATLAQAA